MAQGRKRAAAKVPATEPTPAKQSGPSTSRLLTKEEITQRLSSPVGWEQLERAIAAANGPVAAEIASELKSLKAATASAVLAGFKQSVQDGNVVLLSLLLRICDQEDWAPPEWLRDAGSKAYTELTTTGRQGTLSLSELKGKTNKLYQCIRTCLHHQAVLSLRASNQHTELFQNGYTSEALTARSLKISLRTVNNHIVKAKQYLAGIKAREALVVFGVSHSAVKDALNQ